MPDWQPNRNKVVWNYGVAHDAANELRRAANLLEETAAQRVHAAADAQKEWRGRYREQFDRDLSDMINRARDLAQQMRIKAQQIEDASNRARAEEIHRKNEIERWYREKREEERKAQERKEEKRENG